MYDKIFKCQNCKNQISPYNPYCQYCGNKTSYELRAKFLGRKLMYINCHKCSCNTSFVATTAFFEMSTCCDCGSTTSLNKSNDNLQYNNSELCPYCGSNTIYEIPYNVKITSENLLGVLHIKKLTTKWRCCRCGKYF